ncbi:ABC transporter substrate-binding protein [Bacillus gobiensis]|uniref:ABC transporter substrate-binding protein n=1 Tax=Bacillus gobiensis TaxID=1441095 RepID=UPI003D248809
MLKMKALSLLLMAFVLVISGCSSSSTSGEKRNEEKKDEVVTIVYSKGQDATGGTKKIVEEFNKRNPKIQVKFREMPADTGQQHDAYVTMFNGGSSEIDVMELDTIWPAEFAQAGYLVELDRFLQQDKDIKLEDYNQRAVSAASFNGKQWAMPKYIDTGLLFYRKDIIAEDEVPKTWDELVASAKENQGKNGMKYGYLMQAKQYEGLVCNGIEFISSYGGKFLDDNGKVVVNSPETIKGVAKMVEVATMDAVPDNVTTFIEQESHTAFIEGQSPLIRNWPYQYSLANDPEQSKIVDKIGVAPLPAGDAGTAAALGGWMTGINKFSKHKKEAWEFVKFMTGPEGQKIGALYGALAPTIPALYEDKEIIEKNPFFAEEGFQKGLETAVPRPVTANYPEVSEVIQIELSKAIAKEVTPEQAVQNMEKELKAVLGQ